MLKRHSEQWRTTKGLRSSKLREDYAQLYCELYNRHWWWRARERLILDVLRDQQPSRGWRRILDVGCGDGLFFDELLQFGEVEGVELSSALVSADGPHRSRIHVGNFDPSLPLDGDFGLILMLDVLEHMHDPVAALRFALSKLDSDGKLLITVPAFNTLWTNHDVINHHVTRYTKSSFREVAREAGVFVEADRYFFHWLFPIKAARRMAERVLGSKPTPAQAPPEWINRTLYRFSLLENQVSSILPLPFGSSLLVFGSRSNAKSLQHGIERIQA